MGVLLIRAQGFLRSLCDDDFQVFGFSDMEPRIVGYQSLIVAVAELRRRITGLSFEVDDVAVLEEGVLITWAMRGLQQAKVSAHRVLRRD